MIRMAGMTTFRFVEESKGTGSAYGTQKSYVNVDDIANLNKIGDNHWQATSKSGAKNPDGTDTVYHFDDKTVGQLLNCTI